MGLKSSKGFARFLVAEVEGKDVKVVDGRVEEDAIAFRGRL